MAYIAKLRTYSDKLNLRGKNFEISLIFEGKKLGDEKIKELAKYLKSYSSLKQLDLGRK
jgi:hypothetical protein